MPFFRGGGESAEARDEDAASSVHSEAVHSVSMQSWASDASCVRGDLSFDYAKANGEMSLRPEAGEKRDPQAFDGDFSESAYVDNDRELGSLGTFGVLCGN